MDRIPVVLPQLDLPAFNCARCGIYAVQSWFYMKGSSGVDGFGRQWGNQFFRVSECASCDSPTIWLGKKMVFPPARVAGDANPDLPEDIRADYDEANSIAARSPRGAAALLRLAIQKLVMHLGQPGKNLNDDIKSLVSDGLPAKVQKALDSVRVIGNDAVHPGEIDLRDDADTASMLFRLVNFIAEKMISEPKHIEAIYASLPKSKIEAINKRDNSN